MVVHYLDNDVQKCIIDIRIALVKMQKCKPNVIFRELQVVLQDKRREKKEISFPIRCQLCDGRDMGLFVDECIPKAYNMSHLLIWLNKLVRAISWY